MINLFKGGFKRVSRLFNLYKPGAFLLAFLMIFLGTFFAFEVFGKTTHSLSFSFNLFENIEADEIAQIKISTESGKEQIVRGGRVTVNSGEKIKFQIILKEGYEAFTDEDGNQLLYASNIKENSLSEEVSKINNQSYFQWSTDQITQNRSIEIRGVQTKKLRSAVPTVITSEGETLKFEDFQSDYQPTFDYNNKYRFKIKLETNEALYDLNQVTADIIRNEKLYSVSCESKKLDENYYEIIIYDDQTKGGGIRNPINKIEMVVSKTYKKDKVPIIFAEGDVSAAEATQSTITIKAVDDSDVDMNLTSDMIDIYLWSGSASATPPDSPIYENGNTLEGVTNFISKSSNDLNFFEVSVTPSDKTSIYVKAKANYSNSNFNFYKGAENLTAAKKDVFSRYDIDITENTELKIKGIKLNEAKVTFTVAAGEKDPSIESDIIDTIENDAVEIYVYEGISIAPDSPLDTGNNLKEGCLRINYDETDSNFSYTSYVTNNLTFYIIAKSKYSQSDYKVSYGENLNKVTLESQTSEEGFNKYAINLDSDYSFSIEDIKINEYKITFSSENNPGALLINDYVRFTNETDQGFSTESSGVITFKHGEKPTIKLKAKEHYNLSEATVEFNPFDNNYSFKKGEETGEEGRKIVSEGSINFGEDGITENIEIKVSNITFIMYKISFLDNANVPIGENQANIFRYPKVSNSASIINGGTEVSSGSDFSFIIEFKEGYEGLNNLVVTTVGGGEFIKDANSKNIFSYSGKIKSDITVQIGGINRIKYGLTFTCPRSLYKENVEISYGGYTTNEKGDFIQSVTRTEEVKWGKNINDFIPYGSDFTFHIKVKDGDYILPDMTSKDFNLDDYITYKNVSATNTEIEKTNDNEFNITFKEIKFIGEEEDNNQIIEIELKKLLLRTHIITFNINEADAENRVLIYSVENTDENTINLLSKDVVFNSNSGRNEYEIKKGSNKYIAVELQEGIKKPTENDLKCQIKDKACTLIKGKSFTKDGKPLDNKVYLFEIEDNNMQGDSSIISIEKIELIPYDVVFEGFEETATIKAYVNELAENIYVEGKASVKYGKSLNAEIEIPGGNLSSSSIIVRSKDSGSSVNYKKDDISEEVCKIRIPSITSDLIVKFVPDIEVNTITFEDVEGLKYFNIDSNNKPLDPIRGSVTVKKGESYVFAVKADTGYDLKACKMEIKERRERDAFIPDSSSTNDMLIFKIENVETSLTIKGTIEKLRCCIKLTSTSELLGESSLGNNTTQIKYYQNNTEITDGKILVEYGSGTEFSILLEDKCKNSELKVNLYKWNEEEKKEGEFIEELHSINGIYKLLDVRQDATIKVENLKWNQYVLNFVKNDYACFVSADNSSIVIDGTQSVIHGEEYKFKIAERSGYVLGDSTIVNAVSSSGEAQELLTDSYGNYILTNVQESYTISIENVDNIVYTLNFTPVNGVTYLNDQGTAITGKVRVNYGDNFEFSMEVDDAYSDSLAGAYVLLNDGKNTNVQVQKLASGRYLLQNITEDLKVKAANVVKNKYVITLTKDEGIDYYTVSNNICTGENEVGHGETFYFRVKLHSLYLDSKIRVMLGNQELSANEEKVYKVENVKESKVVTVVGIEKNDVATIIENIERLPSTAKDANDIEQVIEVTRQYNALDDYKKSTVTNYSVLKNLQESLAEFHHVYNGVEVEGLDWYIKIVANPILSDMDACSRIYDKLKSEYILDLYDVYLWDVINNRRYTLPEGKTVVVHLPTPDMSYFENLTGIHENTQGNLDYLNLNISGGTSSLEVSSFSPLGIVANRSIQPGRSSLIDAADANLSTLTDYALTALSGSSRGNSDNSNSLRKSQDENEGLAVDEEMKSPAETESNKNVDNSVTPLGSALKLVLIIMIIGIILAIAFTFVNKRKNSNDKNRD